MENKFTNRNGHHRVHTDLLRGDQQFISTELEQVKQTNVFPEGYQNVFSFVINPISVLYHTPLTMTHEETQPILNTPLKPTEPYLAMVIKRVGIASVCGAQVLYEYESSSCKVNSFTYSPKLDARFIGLFYSDNFLFIQIV